jgi:hypothetical protein
LEKGTVDGIRFVDADNIVLLEHLQQFAQGNGNAERFVVYKMDGAIVLIGFYIENVFGKDT